MDTSFTVGDGFDDSVNIIQIQSDGKIIVGGFFSSYSGTSMSGIVRLNTDGSLDTSFQIGTGLNGGGVQDIGIQLDGKIVICGGFSEFSGVTSVGLARLNSDGSLDTSLYVGNGFDGGSYALVLQSNGKIIIGGSSSLYNDIPIGNLVRINSDGSLDTSLNIQPRFYHTIYALSIKE